MKKFLKVFIIVILVLAVIGGTSYFFFMKLEKDNKKTGSIVAMLESESKMKYDDNLLNLHQLVNSDGTDNRIELLIETNQNLDRILFELSTYYVETETSINNKEINNKLRSVKSTGSLLNRMMTEYSIKKDSLYFNRHIGANDFYNKSCDYLVEYAELIKLISSNIKNVNKTSDLKFNMFDIYSNIVINTFNKTKEDNNKVEVEFVENIDKFHEIFEIENSFIKTNVNQFSSKINEFNEYYSKSNKKLFALDFAINIRSVNSSAQNTNEENATYILKLIFGI